MNNYKSKKDIIDSYDDIMRDYFSSPEVDREINDWNDWFFSFGRKLTPELRDEYYALLRFNEKIAQKTAEEALYRGNQFKKVEPETPIE